MDRIDLAGLTFSVRIEHDDFHGAPWEENDGHGIVSEWTGHGEKRAGERLLVEDRGWARYYDFAGTMEIAKRDEWGMPEAWIEEQTRTLGRPPTKGEIRAAAVERDFEYLRRWCNYDWHYVGVVVTLLDTDGDETWESESLWGIESDATEYIEEVARNLAKEIAERIGEDTHTLWLRRPIRCP